MIITTAWLEERGACANQVELFGRTFGDGGAMTPGNIEAASAAGLDLNWFAKVVLPPPAWAEYRRIMATAWDEYRRATATARAEYERATATAWDEFQRATANAWDEYERATAHARAEYVRARATALIGILWPEAAGEGMGK